MNCDSYINKYDDISLYDFICSVEANEDPIKGKIFSYEQLSKIFADLSVFPISRSNYYYIKEDIQCDKILLNYYVFSYVTYNQIMKKKRIEGYYEEKTIQHLGEFLTSFYDINLPKQDTQCHDIMWVYPKIEYKCFFTECVTDSCFDRYYVDKQTVRNLIEIIAGFSKYEMENLSQETLNECKNMNLPTMIYANIQLYDKGYLKLKKNGFNIEISLDPNPQLKQRRVFSRNKTQLKEDIIKICQDKYQKKFTINDFIQ
ncbi:MAG: hypothetical protein ACOYVK_01230 [Bacillota bacterium]